jgi:hypothetical protein
VNNKFFEKFPLVSYNGRDMRNLILKSRVIRDVLSKIEVMHPFVINDGERADTVAYDYYGDSELYWLVYMCNDIVDPYYDWPLDQQEFRAYIIKKYGSLEAALQQQVYWSHPDHDYYMTVATKSLLSPSETTGWITPVYAYDIENENNENKRNIRLIDSAYVSQIVSEISKIYG